MTKFKVGDKFIPHIPKDKYEAPSWVEEMDEYDGKVLTVSFVNSLNNICTNETCFTFSPDWCEKVEENQSVETNEKVEEYIPETNKTIDWGKLRNAFFKECTEDKGGVRVVNMAPHDLFEWLVKRVEKG